MKEKALHTFDIGVIAGDGVGPEVIAEGIKALEAIAKADPSVGFEFTYYPWGCNYYLSHGKMMDFLLKL